MDPAHRRPTAQVIWRYCLFQLPELLLLAAVLAILGGWLDLPGWVWAVVLGGWALKDVLLFPFIWRAYDDRQPTRSNSLIDAQGVALVRLDPQGHVRVRAERWKAELAPGARPVEADEPVRVVGLRGLTLLVESARVEDGTGLPPPPGSDKDSSLS